MGDQWIAADLICCVGVVFVEVWYLLVIVLGRNSMVFCRDCCFFVSHSNCRTYGLGEWV